MKRQRLLRFLVFTTLLVSGVSPPTVGSESDWPGWRGLSREGKAVGSNTPTHWARDYNVSWKTAIPGSGYSSPVVSGESVYVTTAYAGPTARPIRETLERLLLVLSLAVTLVAIRIIVDSCSPGHARGGAIRDLLPAAVFSFVLIIVNGFLQFGEGVFDFKGSDIRSWLSSSIVVSFCLILVAYRLEQRTLRVTLGALCVLFSIFSLLCIPGRDAVFAKGVLHLSAQVILATSALPLFIGVVIFWKTFAWRATAREVIGATALVTVLAGLVLFQMLFKSGSFLRYYVGDARFQPLLGWWAAAICGGAFALALLYRVLAGRTLVSNLALVTAASIFGIAASLTIIEQLAARSLYLSYQITNPNIEPRCGWTLLASAAAACVIWLVGCAIRATNHHQAISPRTFVSFRAGVLIMAVASFVHANNLEQQDQFVRAIVCLDRQHGDVKWICEGLPGEQEKFDRRNSPATPTPVVFGQRVYAYFGNPGLMCCDVRGNLLWSNRTLPYENIYGPAASPIVSDGILVLVGDVPQRDSYIRAFDCETGELIWASDWPGDHTVVSGNCRTPLVKQINGQKVVLLWGQDYVRAFELHSGREAWRYSFERRVSDLVASMVSDETSLYLSDRSGGTVALGQSKLAKNEDPLIWTNTKAGATCVSPVISNGMLFTITDGGVADCIDVQSGRTLWRERLKGQYFASLVASGDRVYFTNSAGLTTVVACEGAFRKLAENDLAEETFASFAPVGGQLFIRTVNHVYCVEEYEHRGSHDLVPH